MNIKNWANRFKSFIADEQGQSTTEYILILAVVVMIAMKFKEKFQRTMENATNKLNDNMNNMLSDP